MATQVRQGQFSELPDRSGLRVQVGQTNANVQGALNSARNGFDSIDEAIVRARQNGNQKAEDTLRNMKRLMEGAISQLMNIERLNKTLY